MDTMKTKKGSLLKRCTAWICGVLLMGMSLTACSPKTPVSSDPGETTSAPKAGTTTSVSENDTTTEGTLTTDTDATGTADSTTSKKTRTTTRTEGTTVTDNGNTVAEVRMVNGMPRLYVGGKRREPIYFMPPHFDFNTNESLDSQMKYASQYNVDLFIYPYSWENHDMRRFFNSALKSVVESMLAYNPDAYLILRLDVTASLEKMGLDRSEAAWLNGVESGNPSMASDAWYAKAKEIFKNVVENVMSDEYLSKYVIGFEVLGGNSGEWFEYDYWDGMMDTSESNRKGFCKYLAGKYKTDAALQTAWGDSLVKLNTATLPDHNDLPGINHDGNQGNRPFLMTAKADQKYVDYFDYLNNQRAERLGGFADVIKEASNDTKLAIVYYGYQFETPTASSAHMATSKLLTYDSIDMLSGPVSYSDRNDGGIGAYMGFIDSVTAAGKMWMDEGDYRSPVHTIEPGAPSAHPATTALMNQVMRREVAKCMVFNTGVWWLDLQGAGWFNYESFWKKNETMMNLMNNYYNVQKKKTPDVCVILDESAMSLVSNAHGYAANGLQGARSTLFRSGYDFGTYLVEDVINGKVDDAKVYIFLNPWRLSSAEVTALEKKIHQKGKVSLFMYGNGLTSEADFKKLTGMSVHSAQGGSMAMSMQAGVSGSVAQNSLSVSPAYYVDGSGVKTLGTYTSNGAAGKAGMASYTQDGWTSVFYGGTHLNGDMLAYLAGLAGVHRFSTSNDTLYADDQMVVLHATTEGKKTVQFPTSCTIYNLETNSWTTGKSITVNAYKGQTIILFYGEEKTLHKIVG